MLVTAFPFFTKKLTYVKYVYLHTFEGICHLWSRNYYLHAVLSMHMQIVLSASFPNRGFLNTVVYMQKANK